MTTPPAVVWFRNDLRLTDNPALAAACAAGPVTPLYIMDDDPAIRPMGAASRWWLNKSLRALQADFARRGIPLVLRRGSPGVVIRQVVAEAGAGAVYWNRLYDPAAVGRDSQIKADLVAHGVKVLTFNAALINEPWEVRTASGAPYRVFTPYWRAARPLADLRAPTGTVDVIRSGSSSPPSEDLESWSLHPANPDWSMGFSDWRPGEAGAQARLEAFIHGDGAGYLDVRNQPGVRGTSRLSPHLHFGEIGPRQVWRAINDAVCLNALSERHANGFLRELGWREFNYQLLYHFPKMQSDPFNKRFADFPWLCSPREVSAWRRGMTGFPIVDAGMRELWATGWMHNRVRMITASFLVKHLMVHWKVGESWFWDTLVDADVANNIGGWQWVAGSGADAAPYFRIFNPMLQGQTFDEAGDYVRRWVPELARLPDSSLHQPWRAGSGVLAAAGVRLGSTYPAPIVDHSQARNRALAAYERLK